jgi:hypothetical protein
LLPAFDREAAIVLLARRVEGRHADLSRRGSDGLATAVDVGHAVERHVRAQALKDNPLRLEGNHRPRVPHLPGKEERVRADIGTDLDHHRARLNDLPKQIDLSFRELSIQFKRLADVAIVLVIEHFAVATVGELIEGKKVEQFWACRRLRAAGDQSRHFENLGCRFQLRRKPGSEIDAPAGRVDLWTLREAGKPKQPALAAPAAPDSPASQLLPGPGSRSRWDRSMGRDLLECPL